MVANHSSAVRSTHIAAGTQGNFFGKDAKPVRPRALGQVRMPQPQARTFAARPQMSDSSARSIPPSRNVRKPEGDNAAAQTVNKVTLRGRLGRDAVIRQTSNGHTVANFSIGVDEFYKDQSGERKKKTAWYRVQAWEDLAEAVGAELRAGARVHIEGRLTVRMWTDQENQKHFSTEIVASDVRLLNERPMPEPRTNGALGERIDPVLQ